MANLVTYHQREYFDYLKQQINYLDANDDYSILLETLHGIEFIFIHPMDENRAGDAIHFRVEYEHIKNTTTELWDSIPSVFEVLVSLAIRMNYIFANTDEDLTKDCFWCMLDNLGLRGMDDVHFAEMGGEVAVYEIVTRWMSRSYDISGEGGLFPMARPRGNQREVELFYQMNQWASDPNGIEFKRRVSGGVM